METGIGHLKARQYLDNLAARGRYHFTAAEAQKAFGPTAAKSALSRFGRQGLTASPARGFYVVIPPEYRTIGCLPAEQFIPALMEALDLPYYAGLLTAAQYYGAAHQRPQEFQVFLGKKHLPIACGKVKVAFMVRKRLRDVPVTDFNTQRGTLRVSTPEATALDLVGYYHHAGGLDQVATVLSELAEKIDPDKLLAVAGTAPLPWAQRLGYLLERVGGAEKARELKAYVRARAHQSAVLLPEGRRAKASRDKDWRLYVNTDVEVQE